MKNKTFLVASNTNYTSIVVTSYKEMAEKIARADFERKWGICDSQFFTAYPAEEYFVNNSAYSIEFDD